MQCMMTMMFKLQIIGEALHNTINTVIIVPVPYESPMKCYSRVNICDADAMVKRWAWVSPAHPCKVLGRLDHPTSPCNQLTTLDTLLVLQVPGSVDVRS
jgi:hypothetical protein